MTSSKKINIVFALPTLYAGGAERVMSYIAQKINKEKFNATLLIIGFSKDASYDIKGIDVIFLERPRVLTGALPFFNFIRKSKPDIIISAIGHLNSLTAIFSLFFPRIKFIAREVNVLSVLSKYENERKKNSILGSLTNRRFILFDKVVCQSKDMLDDFVKNFNIKKNKLIVINNPISDNFKLKNVRSVNNPIQFITIARLDGEKGHDRILKALSKVNFDFNYTIIGAGSLEKEIFSMIKDYELGNNITYIPFTKDVVKYLSESDLYLQGSYTEGFPNSIIESCMVGTPVLAFNAPGGINEIIYNNVNGVIVENIDEYVQELNKISSNYLFIPENVSISVQKRYNSKLIIKEYENLFINVLNT